MCMSVRFPLSPFGSEKGFSVFIGKGKGLTSSEEVQPLA